MFTDPIPRFMVYLFVKHGLKFFVEYNITYTCKFFRDFVHMNVLLKKKMLYMMKILKFLDKLT